MTAPTPPTDPRGDQRAPAWANELHVAPATSSAAQARAFVQEYCEQHELLYLVDGIRLVAGQLVANAVPHAQARIRVTLDELPFCVQLTVYDESVEHPMARLATRVLAGQYSEHPEHDERGTDVVDACSTDWGTDVTGEEGKRTWAQFALRPKPSWNRTAPAGVCLVGERSPAPTPAACD